MGSARRFDTPDISFVTRRDQLTHRVADAHNAVCPPLVMGILNVTPDSFSDGGLHNVVDAALSHAQLMSQQGAAVIDVGGESTRPGAEAIDAKEELRRVLPVVETASNMGLTISCDTYKSEVALQAAAAGAVMINDVGGLQSDKDMSHIVAEAGVMVVIMHGLHAGISGDVSDSLAFYFDASLRIADEVGIPRDRIVLDPGIGFNKSDAENAACFSALPSLRRRFDLPLLMGVSRKSLLGRLLDRPVSERLHGSLAAAVMAAVNGASIVRVHDVAPHFEAMRTAHYLGSPFREDPS